MSYSFLLIISSLLIIILTSLQGIHAIEYNVVNNAPNTPGGARFDREIGIPFTKQIMKRINHFIWKILQGKTSADRKNVSSVTIFISDFIDSQAYTSGNNINVSTKYIQDSTHGAKWDFTSLMYHEMTHVFQWSADDTAPSGLIEGVAEYVMIKSGYYDKTVSAKPGSGNKWDDGYDTTARFLEYCDGLLNGFTAKLNKKMRYEWRENFFVELLGKPDDQLWKEYKAKYNKSPAKTDIAS